MLASKEGQKVPEVTFKVRKHGEWAEVTSRDLFTGKKVVVFSLPGAFTPTCSSAHLPRYAELAEVFKENGVDEVACLAVNDAFVMEAWAKDQGIQNVVLLPDGNGEFTEKMGMLVDKNDLGFGKRSWRYSMLVDDGVIEKMFIEPEREGDPFEVSDADSMLRAINPHASLPHEVTIITKPGCAFCKEAKRLLSAQGYQYEEISLGSGVTFKSLRNLSGENTAPQIFIDGQHIAGGLEGLKDYLQHHDSQQRKGA